MARKDKKQIIGEPMTDEQIRAFLHGSRENGLDEDHHALLRAYRSLRSEDFSRFVTFFLTDGRNINATDPAGKTALSIISSHQQSADYAETLKRLGGG
ncbi:MAG: PA4642 family protein [Alcanivoracaceae bacterium]|nr:PA4642 family protein [Alcanivoracaceae bacterium]